MTSTADDGPSCVPSPRALISGKEVAIERDDSHFNLLIQLTLNRFRQLFLSSQPQAAYSATAVLIYWVPAERGASKGIHISQLELPIKDLKAG